MAEEATAEEVDTTGTALGGDAPNNDQPANAPTDQPDPPKDDPKPKDDLEEEGKSKDDDPEKGKKSEDKPEAEAFDPDKLEVPEGFELDQQMMEQFSPLAKELNLGQEQAQKLISMHSQAIQSVRERAEAQAMEAIQQKLQSQQEKWVEETRSDEDIGGANTKTAVDNAMRTMRNFVRDEAEFKQFLIDLNESRFGDNPTLIRILSGAGKAISEDTFDRSQGGTGQKQSTADRMYPNEE